MMIITIDETGAIQFVYTDKLVSTVRQAGLNLQINRLSDVEPDEGGLWTVHFRHKSQAESVKFEDRETALAYEVELANRYLKEGML